MGNSQNRGGVLRIKSPQALPPAHHVNKATAPHPTEPAHSPGNASGNILSDLAAAGLLGLGLWAAVVHPRETAAFLRRAFDRKRVAEAREVRRPQLRLLEGGAVRAVSTCGVPCRSGCPSDDRCDGGAQ